MQCFHLGGLLGELYSRFVLGGLAHGSEPIWAWALLEPRLSSCGILVPQLHAVEVGLGIFGRFLLDRGHHLDIRKRLSLGLPFVGGYICRRDIWNFLVLAEAREVVVLVAGRGLQGLPHRSVSPLLLLNGRDLGQLLLQNLFLFGQGVLNSRLGFACHVCRGLPQTLPVEHAVVVKPLHSQRHLIVLERGEVRVPGQGLWRIEFVSGRHLLIFALVSPVFALEVPRVNSFLRSNWLGRYKLVRRRGPDESGRRVSAHLQVVLRYNGVARKARGDGPLDVYRFSGGNWIRPLERPGCGRELRYFPVRGNYHCGSASRVRGRLRSRLSRSGLHELGLFRSEGRLDVKNL